MTRYRCAAEARERDEPRYGTASHVRRWLLLEQPGPWGRDALIESRMPAAVATELESTAADVNARVILIRRTRGRSARQRRCFVVRSDLALVEELVLDDVTDLLDVDLTPLAAGRPVGGTPWLEPLHLVCTNGRHDACCAEYGRPLALALSGAVGERVWECSHIGGDRFAGNLVCFPHGLYFGHVGPAEGPDVALQYERGLIDLDHYRGRSSHSFVVQAAEYFLRSDRDLRHVDDLVFTTRRVIADDAFRVVFADRPGQRWTVDVRVERDSRDQRLTCQATVAARPPRYALLAIAGSGSPSSSSSSSTPPPSARSRPCR
ncbi:MAG TPA: sucrase ferredoxin [Egibacteraceae bacterium]|nr:sucrase ferredoxin [Egibacteraceae bacterium]